jgi:uncharacterized membrane protein
MEEVVKMQYYPERLILGILIIIAAFVLYFPMAYYIPDYAGMGFVAIIITGIAFVINCVNGEVWDVGYRRL